MQENQLLNLLIKKKNNEITAEEEQELQELLTSAHADEANAVVEMVFASKVDLGHAVSDEAVNASLGRVLSRISNRQSLQRPRHTVSWMKYAAMAAAVILAVSLGWWYWQQPQEPSRSLSTFFTEKGSKSDLVLPDGTKVKINASSKLSYPKSYNESRREVYLEGEAFFDVVKDSKRPFIVHTSTIDIKVLGTAFNVRAYSGEERTETTLIRGSVDISLKEKGNRVIRLHPNEKVVIRNNEKTESTDTPEIALHTLKPLGKDSSLVETQWMKERMVFEQDRLGDIIPQLEKWFDVSISVSDPALLDRRFSGSFKEESLNEVLEIFSLASGTGYQVEKNKVVIYRKTK